MEETTVEQSIPPGPAIDRSGATDSGDPVLPPGGLVPEVSEPGRVVLDLITDDSKVAEVLTVANERR